ncbi:hypothetical protein KI387_025927, partial [Taxus chinensis]
GRLFRPGSFCLAGRVGLVESQTVFTTQPPCTFLHAGRLHFKWDVITKSSEILSSYLLLPCSGRVRLEGASFLGFVMGIEAQKL